MSAPDVLLRTVAAKALYDQRRALAWWLLGLVAFVAFTLAFWPTIRDEGEAFTDLIDRMPAAFKAFAGGITELATPTGYLHGRLFGLAFPLLLVVYAIGRGSDLIAGEEERGQLETLLAEPPGRPRVAVAKATALVAGVAIIAGSAWLALALGVALTDMGADQGRIALGVAGSALLACAYGSLALMLGALTGRKAIAAGATTALAIASWLLDGFAKLDPDLQPALVASLHQYYAAGAQLIGDVEPWRLAVLAAVSILAVAVAAWGFDRRDVGV